MLDCPYLSQPHFGIRRGRSYAGALYIQIIYIHTHIHIHRYNTCLFSYMCLQQGGLQTVFLHQMNLFNKSSRRNISFFSTQSMQKVQQTCEFRLSLVALALNRIIPTTKKKYTLEDKTSHFLKFKYYLFLRNLSFLPEPG